MDFIVQLEPKLNPKTGSDHHLTTKNFSKTFRHSMRLKYGIETLEDDF